MARKSKPKTVKRNAGNAKSIDPKAAQTTSTQNSANSTEEQDQELELLQLKQELEKMYQDSWVNNEELKKAMKNTSF